MNSTGRYPGFRAPQGDGEILSVPDAVALPHLVAQNRVRSELVGVEWFGRSLSEIADCARQEIVRAAVEHTRRYAHVTAQPTADVPLIVTGHQAEFFHPGVWLKNFAAARLARESGGTAINLIIDSDLCRSTAIRVPTGTGDDLHLEMVPFDKARTEMPFEERQIVDREQWNSFGARVASTLSQQVSAPLINDWWPTVVEAGKQEANLGLALSLSRHQRELSWHSHTLEVTQSRICQSEAFRLFAMQLLVHAAKFRDAHNQALTEYRVAHNLKNHAQPMPNLAEAAGWLEAPFWLWSKESPRRRGVFVKPVGDEIVISDLNKLSLTLPAHPELAVERLSAAEAAGIKLRTRALATTLFARLLLADVFIHGIGGAKYDQVTDHICELFFGFALPRYATVSGTLRLRLAAGETQSLSEQDFRQELRSMRFHPERFRDGMNVQASEAGELERLLADKRGWIKTPKTPANAADRHRGINAANERLQTYLTNRRAALEQTIVQARLDAIAAQLRMSREYAFCLFPESRLRGFFRI